MGGGGTQMGPMDSVGWYTIHNTNIERERYIYICSTVYIVIVYSICVYQSNMHRFFRRQVGWPRSMQSTVTNRGRAFTQFPSKKQKLDTTHTQKKKLNHTVYTVVSRRPDSDATTDAVCAGTRTGVLLRQCSDPYSRESVREPTVL